MKKELGNWGEKIAIEYLLKNKYKILETNYYKNHLEADIIAQKNDEIIFVEVKTRTKNLPYDNLISTKKEQNLIELADFYLREKQLNLNVRFDVILIVKKGEKYFLNHIKSAFEPNF